MGNTKKLAESLVLELYTDQTIQPFLSLKRALEELKELNNFIL